MFSYRSPRCCGVGLINHKLCDIPERTGCPSRATEYTCGWQTLSKAERAQITIQGEPVVEIDYAQMHPTLAYARAGRPPPEEAYAIPGYERGLCKVAFNVMLNSSNRNGARYTIAHKPQMVEAILGEGFCSSGLVTDLWRDAADAHPCYAQKAYGQADKLIEAIMARHRPIQAMFFTGVGLALQRMDSDIAQAVMCEMLRRGVVVLPIHDSFIAPASKSSILEGVMLNEAAKAGVALKCRCS